MSFPEISPNGSLLLAWQLKSNKKVLIVGGGNVAADRIRSVLAAYNAITSSPTITVICPEDGLNDEVRYRLHDAEQKKLYAIEHVDRNWDDQLDLVDDESLPDMVLTATDDATLSERIYRLCKHKRINVNVADVPPLCDFYFGSVIKRGPLQILVSTNGKGPRLANRIRKKIEDTLPVNIGQAIEAMGLLRAELRQRAPDAKDTKKRMEWMIKVTDRWSLDELCLLDAEKRAKILDGFENDVALGYNQVRGVGIIQRIQYSMERMRPQCWEGLAVVSALAFGFGTVTGAGLFRLWR